MEKVCIEKNCGESICGKEVSLMEMLDAREKRCMLQKHLLNTCQTPLICLTLNIPGPVKVLPGVPKTFDTACSRIRAALKASAVNILHTEIIKEKTGYEAFFSADASPELLKELMIPLEDQDRLGRLFDIDVLRLDGQKVSREELSHAPRRCLLCSESAHVCSRSRRHSVPELTAEINRILADTADASGAAGASGAADASGAAGALNAACNSDAADISNTAGSTASDCNTDEERL